MKTNGFGYAFMGRCLVTAVFLLMLAFTWVWAHGGGEPQLTNAVAGPYRVSVWTQPEPMRVQIANGGSCQRHYPTPMLPDGRIISYYNLGGWWWTQQLTPPK